MTEREFAALIARCARMDRSAFRCLYECQAPKMYKAALRITRRSDLAEDAVQDAFLQIWQKAAVFDPAHGSASAWMVSIVRYRALDTLRRRPQDIVSLTDELTENLSAPGQDGLTAITLRLCLAKVSPDRRRLLTLSFTYGYSHEEIASRLAKPLGSVKSDIRRALNVLRSDTNSPKR